VMEMRCIWLSVFRFVGVWCEVCQDELLGELGERGVCAGT